MKLRIHIESAGADFVNRLMRAIPMIRIRLTGPQAQANLERAPLSSHPNGTMVPRKLRGQMTLEATRG